ncbi:unnamed protein product, partial [Didymodactylos carnosus]
MSRLPLRDRTIHPPDKYTPPEQTEKTRLSFTVKITTTSDETYLIWFDTIKKHLIVRREDCLSINPDKTVAKYTMNNQRVLGQSNFMDHTTIVFMNWK